MANLRFWPGNGRRSNERRLDQIWLAGHRMLSVYVAVYSAAVFLFRRLAAGLVPRLFGTIFHSLRNRRSTGKLLPVNGKQPGQVG